MASATSQGLRRLRVIAATVTTLTLVGASAASPGNAQPAENSDAIPGVDEISHSPNLRQVAHVPPQAPFENGIATDIAFQGRYAFVGNYGGFVIYDILNPHRPTIVTQVVCPGGQNDISVYGDLLFLSTDASRSDDSCNSVGQPPTEKDSWEGIKIFDISDKRSPAYLKSVETNCGSHTHTLVPDVDGASVYIYVSSYFPDERFPDCQPPHDLISIIEVPLGEPTDAAVVAMPDLFPDGGNVPGNPSIETTGCHDITAFPAKDLAAGACMGDGILLDIADPEAPRVIDQVRDLENFAFWHSATFSNAGTRVVFTDELGGGVGAHCNPQTGPDKGADAIYDIVGSGDDRTLVFRSYFKIPRTNADTENCVAHNGSLVPVVGRDIMVQSWYQGGVSVWEFTDPTQPTEIAFWERGPISDTELAFGGTWSAYYYNGFIYSSDQKGLDVLDLKDPFTRTAKLTRYDELNVQTQPEYGHRGRSR